MAVLTLCAINSIWNNFSISDVSMALLAVAAIIYFITYIFDFRTAVMAALTWSTSLALIKFTQSCPLNMTPASLITIIVLSLFTTIKTGPISHKAFCLLIFCTCLVFMALPKQSIISDGTKCFFQYSILDLPIMIAPWVAIIPMALITPFQKAWQQKRKYIILIWVWSILALIYALKSNNRELRDILIAIPPIAILIGIVLEDLIFTQKVYSKRFATIFFQYHITAVLFGAIGAAAFASGKAPHLLPQFIILMITTLTLAATIVLLFMKKMRIAATAVIFASVSLLAMAIMSIDLH